SVDSMLNWSDHEVKQLDSKARYPAFKLKELDKSEEPKALLSVDSMLNWSDHEGEDEEKGAAQVYGMIAGDDDDATSDVSEAAAEFALMGVSSQVQAYKNTLQTLEQQKAWYQSNQLALEERIRILTADLENTTNMLKYTEKLNDQVKLEKLNDQVKLEESKARFDKWKESSKNLDKLINSSMSSRSKFGLGFGETFGSDEVFDPGNENQTKGRKTKPNKRQNQARDGKDKVKSKLKSVKVKSQPSEENTTRGTKIAKPQVVLDNKDI
ncbi:hypothetical protein Tco_1480445, partial [Tanacetum coccineum]